MPTLLLVLALLHPANAPESAPAPAAAPSPLAQVLEHVPDGVSSWLTSGMLLGSASGVVAAVLSCGMAWASGLGLLLDLVAGRSLEVRMAAGPMGVMADGPWHFYALGAAASLGTLSLALLGVSVGFWVVNTLLARATHPATE